MDVSGEVFRRHWDAIFRDGGPGCRPDGPASADEADVASDDDEGEPCK